MINKAPHKNNYLKMNICLILIFLFLPAITSCKENSNKIEGIPEDVVEVIVSDTPLHIPKEFKDAVTSLGGKFIIIGDGKTVRLLSLEGVYFNPCFSESSGKVDMSVFNEAKNTCKLVAGLSETNMVMAQKFGGGGGGGSGCGTCTGNGASRWCKKSTDKYNCSGQGSSCETNC